MNGDVDLIQNEVAALHTKAVLALQIAHKLMQCISENGTSVIGVDLMVLGFELEGKCPEVIFEGGGLFILRKKGFFLIVYQSG